MRLWGAFARNAFPIACLIAAVLAAPGAHAATDTAGAEQQVLMRADKIVYDTQTGVVSAEGHVEIDYEDRILLASQITYDQKTDTVTASGKISVLAPDGNVAFADHVVLTNKMRDGVLQGFQALIAKSGRLAATRAVREDGKLTYAIRAAYTPCKICDKPGQRTPTWEVRAGQIIWDEQRHRIYYHDATLELFGVPVIYTPIFSHADPTVKHKSGLLVPEVGSSTTIGTFVTLPAYIAFSDSRDMTVAPMITTEGGDILQAEYRQRWNNGGMWLQATGGYNPNGGLSGHEHQWYSSLFGSGRIPFTNVWSTGYDVALSSNNTYLKRYDLSQQDNLVSDLYLEAISGRSRLALTGYFFQDLRVCDATVLAAQPCGHVSSSEIPIVLPLFEYTYIPRRDPLGGQFRFDLSSASVMRDLGADSERISSEMRWQREFVTDSGQLVNFTAGLRGDVYRVSVSSAQDTSIVTDVRGNPLPLGTNYISRGQPYAAIDWRWPFVSTGRSGGGAFVIEPIAQLIAETYGGNSAGIPNEDSTDFELDETDVFSIDRLPGHALWESGPRANIGIRSEAYLPSGSIEFLLGEVFRLKPDRLLAAETGFGDKTSDIVGRYTVRFPPYLSLTHRVDIDTSGGGIRRNEVYLDGNYGRSNLEIGYIKLNEAAAILGGAREEANAQFTLGFLNHWALFAAARRNLEENKMLNTAFGLGWEDDCLGFSVAWERRYTRILDVPPSTSILFRIKLKVGPDDQDWSLFPQHIFATP